MNENLSKKKRRYKWKANLHEERDYQLLFIVHKFIAQINIPAAHSPSFPFQN